MTGTRERNAFYTVDEAIFPFWWFFNVMKEQSFFSEFFNELRRSTPDTSIVNANESIFAKTTPIMPLGDTKSSYFPVPSLTETIWMPQTLVKWG
jgi:hypothetical protein